MQTFLEFRDYDAHSDGASSARVAKRHLASVGYHVTDDDPAYENIEGRKEGHLVTINRHTGTWSHSITVKW